MDVALVVLTLAMFILLVVLLMKRMNVVYCMLIIGVVGLFIGALIKGESFVEGSTNNLFFDLWTYAQSTLISSFTQTGITLCVVLGYVEFMNAIKASDMFAMSVAKVIVKFKNQTVILIIALLLGCVIKWVVPSAVTAFLLMYSTIYPVLRACGIRRITAICAITISLAWSLGPGQPFTGMVYGTYAPEIGITSPEFFVNYELVYFIPVFIVCAVSFLLTTKYFEKKEDAHPVEFLSEDTQMDPNFDTSALGIPGWYGLLPIIPLVLVILFGGQVIPGVKLAVVPVYLMFGMIVVIIEIFRYKSAKKAFDSYQILLDGMGTCFARYASMVWAGALFAGAIEFCGGLNILISAVIPSDMSQTMLLIIGGVAVAIICGLTGQPNLGIFGLGPVIVAAATLIGADLMYVLLPMQAMATGTNILSVAAPVALVAAEKGGIPVTTFIARQFVPCAISSIAIILCCAFMFMPA